MTDPRRQTDEALQQDTKPAKATSPGVLHGKSLVPLESVLCTEELNRRPTRAPDHAKENRALVALAQALADSPHTILQTLAEKILEVLVADSAGVSLLAEDEQSFFWPAVAGAWQPHLGGGTPREFGPCGDVLDCNAPLLFKHPERRYAYFMATTPAAEECLLVPFYLEGKAVGTIWAIAHDDRRKFDAEDLRLLQSLGRFAAAASQSRSKSALEQRLVAARLEDAVQSGQAMEKHNVELRASEEALRRSESELRDFVENAAIGLHWVGPDGIVLWANQTELDLLGYAREEYVGQNITDFHADQPVIADILARLTGGETLHDYEARLRCKDSSIRHVLISSNAFFENEKFVHTRCFTRDITERKQAEEALHENEWRLRYAMESAGLTYVEVDLARGEARTAENFAAVMGYTSPLEQEADVAAGTRILLEHVVPHDRLRVNAALQKFTAGTPVGEIEYRVLGDNGIERWIESRWSIELGLDGKSRKSFATNLDITERKLAEAVLRESEAFNRGIIDSSPDCIKVLDLDGNLLSMHNGQALLGIEDIRPYLNKSWIEFWEGDDRQAAQAAIAAAALGGAGNFVGFFRTLRGEPKWWDVRISPILDANGKPERLLAISRDVTLRRQKELNLEFLASVSDDLVRWTNVDDMMRTVGAKVSAYLRLSLCAFAEIDETAEQVAINHDWHREDVPSLVGVYRLADFVEEEFIRTARAGEVIVVRDTATDPRTGPEKFAALKIASFVCVPLLWDGQWRFALCLYRSVACDWREDEIELARELTARIWTQLERLRTEEALRESQRFLRSSLDALSGHVAVLDESGKILEVNEAWRRFADENQFTGALYGVGASYLQACGQTFPQGSEAPDYARGITDVIAGRRTRFEIEYACHSPTEQRWFVMRVTRFQSPGPVRIVLVHDNCTERKLAEYTLRANEERYRNLFNSIDEGFCVIEMIFDEREKPVDYRFLEVNPSFEKQTGMHDAEGKRIREFAPDFEASWFEKFGDVALTGKPIRFTNESKELNSWFDVYAFRIGGLESRKVAIIFNNVTDRTKAEQALRESAVTLADLDRRKDEFLAMLSHELRNPLAPISNAVHLLRLQKNEDPIQQQARNIIERQVGQLTHLIDDLLEVSRINTGRVQLRQERVVVSGIVERAVESARPLIVQYRHQLTVSLPPQPIWLHADAARLEQVVVNLLTNAAKYTNEAGHIWLTVEQEGDAAVLRVRDTGIGIAPELLPRIFDLFTQAERSLDRSQGGLGIGLCLVQRLVDLHGGTVEARSVVGQGSEFIVRLPVMLTSMPPSPTPSIETVQPPEKCCEVLVVDDNVDAAQSLAILLEMSGHHVRMAYDGPTGLEAALDYRPDVMLLDIGLPGLTGIEVAKRIRQQPTLKNIVLVAMTGYGQETDRQRSQEAGFDHHLVKPADFGKVQKILATVAEKAA